MSQYLGPRMIDAHDRKVFLIVTHDTSHRELSSIATKQNFTMA